MRIMVKNVAEWLDATAARLPDKIAFSDGKLSLTFSPLRAQSRAIASALARRGLFKRPILIALERGPRVIAAFMGAAYSGNFYVPLDMGMPPERISKILATLEPAILITDEKHSALLAQSGASCPVLFYDELIHAKTDERLLSDAAKRQIDSDLLYVLFTSGSTGIPKGVAITHRGVIAYIGMLTETFGFDEGVIFGQTVPFTFDSSLLYIYNVLCNGCTDYIIPKVCFSFATKMIDFLNEYNVNTIYWVPTSYNIIAQSGIFNKRIPQYLTKCYFVGEVMPNAVLNVWRRAVPNALYVNLFGPTEIVGTCLYYSVDRTFADDEPLPIGGPYRNVDVLLITEDNRAALPGETGEICVRSGKIGCGYYNDPERTAAVFTQNPFNTAYPEIIYRTGDLGSVNERGEIMYKGRKDFQIKHLGYRIELGEIETAASAAGGVELCACVYDDTLKRIVLFYTGMASEATISGTLKQKLQPYMIPGKITKLPAMPTNPNGKIDRVTLKTMV
jgi:amino acid adenylation domain-containing protein